MYLLGHNANLVLIQSPPLPADALKGVSVTAAVTRWSGIAQAYIDEDLVDVVKGSELVTISQTLCSLPATLPVWPNVEDLVTIVRINPPVATSVAQPQSEVMKVRFIDGGNVMLGKLLLKLVRA